MTLRTVAYSISSIVKPNRLSSTIRQKFGKVYCLSNKEFD